MYRYVMTQKEHKVRNITRVEKAMEWAKKNFKVRFPVLPMAVEGGMPLRSFVRHFKHHTGMTPLEYIHYIRMLEAKKYLEETDKLISEIYGIIGYNDSTFFHRIFLRSFNITPADYRRACIKERRAGIQEPPDKTSRISQFNALIP